MECGKRDGEGLRQTARLKKQRGNARGECTRGEKKQDEGERKLWGGGRKDEWETKVLKSRKIEILKR